MGRFDRFAEYFDLDNAPTQFGPRPAGEAGEASATLLLQALRMAPPPQPHPSCVTVGTRRKNLERLRSLHDVRNKRDGRKENKPEH
ncbi:hypothetical protein E4U57_006484 [Claviceps arundinis]|uniref:Uncharacterized protein n=1 Tax=Claviceps arundinis TaxID=1623583 RepID=A0ABQ7PKL3_9HYPO|nr:hypothetical protein E4U57_006484 [Claviceps arundinis]